MPDRETIVTECLGTINKPVREREGSRHLLVASVRTGVGKECAIRRKERRAAAGVCGEPKQNRRAQWLHHDGRATFFPDGELIQRETGRGAGRWETSAPHRRRPAACQFDAAEVRRRGGGVNCLLGEETNETRRNGHQLVTSHTSSSHWNARALPWLVGREA